jgi:hypothetical protein
MHSNLSCDTATVAVPLSINLAGFSAGLYTIPIVGAPIVSSIQFQTGSDIPNRDPLTFTLKDPNATGSFLPHSKALITVLNSLKCIY